MAAAVAASSDCPKEVKARIIIRADGEYIRSKVITHPGGSDRFQIIRDGVESYELQARSLSPLLDCSLQVLWSRLEFR
jgi:hypothetical protein